MAKQKNSTSSAKKTRQSKKKENVKTGDIISQLPDAKNRLVTFSKIDNGFLVEEPETGLSFTSDNEATATNVFEHALTNSQKFALSY